MNRSRTEIQKKLSRYPTQTPSNAYPPLLMPAVRTIGLFDDLVLFLLSCRLQGDFCGCCMVNSGPVSSRRAVNGGHMSSAARSREQGCPKESGSDLRRKSGVKEMSSFSRLSDDGEGRILLRKRLDVSATSTLPEVSVMRFRSAASISLAVCAHWHMAKTY